MALEPGDSIQEDTCEQVGNFPHGILKDSGSLALDPGVLGSTMCLTSKKQEYINAFDTNGLEVCNVDNFANINSPYIVKLGVADGEDPGDDLPSGPGWKSLFEFSFVLQESATNFFCFGGFLHRVGADDQLAAVRSLSEDAYNPSFADFVIPSQSDCIPEAVSLGSGTVSWDISYSLETRPAEGAVLGTMSIQGELLGSTINLSETFIMGPFGVGTFRHQLRELINLIHDGHSHALLMDFRGALTIIDDFS